MKVKLLSDIHLEHSHFSIPYDGEDVLVLAGDISPDFREGVEMVEEYLRKSDTVHVVFVLGNHDYHTHTIKETCDFWKELKCDRFHFLQDSKIVLNDVCFYGATFWTDIHKMNSEKVNLCKSKIDDYKLIRNFSPYNSCFNHISSKMMLEIFLENTLEEKVVVISHYLPSYKSIDKRFENSDLNCAFASTDLDSVIRHPKVKYWFHGHTHQNVDYYDGNTRVICNPRGRSTENTNFSCNFILEI